MAEEVVDEERSKSIAKYDAVLTEFMAQRERVISMPETDQHLDQIERFARWTGRYIELVDLYRSAFDTQGGGHYTSPRLVMSYINLGQQRMARQVLDEAIKARPEDARVFFLNGYLTRFEGPAEDKRIALVRDNWTYALKLDPKLERLFPIKASVIQGRIDEINGYLKTPAKPVVTPSTVAPPRGDDGAEGATPRPSGGLNDKEKALIQAESLLAEGKPEAAFNAYSKLQNDHPDDRKAMMGRAISGWRAISAFDRDKATSLVNAVIARTDLTAEELVSFGVFCLREVKDKEKAAGLLRRALELDPAYAKKRGVEGLLERSVE
jgi:tetratricopeptide (TPR) repeat protein